MLGKKMSSQKGSANPNRIQKCSLQKRDFASPLEIIFGYRNAEFRPFCSPSCSCQAEKSAFILQRFSIPRWCVFPH